MHLMRGAPRGASRDTYTSLAPCAAPMKARGKRHSLTLGAASSYLGPSSLGLTCYPLRDGAKKKRYQGTGEPIHQSQFP